MADQRLEISWETIGRILLAGFCVYALFLAREIVIWFFFALTISLLLEPGIKFLIRLRIPKFLAVILVYVSIFGVLSLVIYLSAPIFIEEINQLAKNIPDYFVKINPFLEDFGIEAGNNFQTFTSSLLEWLQDSSASIFKAASIFFGGISSTLVIFTLAFFLSLESGSMEKALALIAPRKYENTIGTFFQRAQFKVSGWFGARLLSCLFVGVVSYIVFFAFGIKYAFILALVSGVLNFVPFIGPAITLVMAVVFTAVSSSWFFAVYVMIALLAIQEIENKFVGPLLMKRFMDMPPLVVLLSLLVGQTLFGFLGMIFFVPVAGILYEFSKEFLEHKKQMSENYQ